MTKVISMVHVSANQYHFLILLLPLVKIYVLANNLNTIKGFENFVKTVTDTDKMVNLYF